MTSTSPEHKNHVGIGVTRTAYNRLKREARKRDLSIRALVDDLTEGLGARTHREPTE